MDLHRLSPYIRVAYSYTVDDGWELKERVIFDYELLYLKAGDAVVRVENDMIACKEGDFVLIKPGQTHSIRTTGKKVCQHDHAHFDLYYREDSPRVRVSYHPLGDITPNRMDWFREDVCSGPEMTIPTRIRLDKPAIAANMLSDIIKEFEQKPYYYEYNAKGIFTQLWVYLLRELHWNSSTRNATHWEAMNAAKEYIRLNPEADITLDELAEMSNFSKSYFIHLFQQLYGTTPGRYQQMLRIDKAKKLIQFSEKSITEIAALCGYKSIHAFSLTFKRVDGVKPTYYRQHGGNVRLPEE